MIGAAEAWQARMLGDLKTSYVGLSNGYDERLPADSFDWVARILDGEVAARQLRDKLRRRAIELAAPGDPPTLATIQVGDRARENASIAIRDRECADVGIRRVRRELPITASQADIEAVIDELNADPECAGLVVERPLPEGLDTKRIRERIDPDKDVEGLHPVNLGRLALLQRAPRPCAARGCVELLRHYGITMAGANIVVIGRAAKAHGTISLSLMSRAEGATVTICYNDTKDLADIVRTADIILSVVGTPGFLTADMVKPWSVVLDIGLSADRTGGGGDVDLRVRDVAGWLAPAVGGVVPMTRAMLLTNVIEAAEYGLMDA